MTASPPQPRPTVLVTGSTKRIGRAIALSLARDGWQIAIHHRNSPHEAKTLAQEILALGSTAKIFAADLTDFDALDDLIQRTKNELGAPTCLINNASEFHLDTLETLNQAAWCKHLDINLKAPVFLAKAMISHLPKGAQGNVINIIDQRVWKLTPDFFSYTISKAGLWTATQTLAQSLAPHVRVNAIGPGPVLRSIHQSDEDFAAEVNSTLLHRGPSLEEIAVAVKFILATPSMTGQMIALDGGQHLT